MSAKKTYNSNYKSKQIDKYGSIELYRAEVARKKRLYRQSKKVAKSLPNNLANNLYDSVFALKTKALKSYKASTHKTVMAKVANLGKSLTLAKSIDLARDAFKHDIESYGVFKDVNRVIEFISNKWSNNNTRLAYITALSGVLKYVAGFETQYEQYSKLSIEYRRNLDVINDELELSDREKKLWYPWDRLSKASNDRTIDTKTRAIVALYSLIPPRRLSMIQYLIYSDDKRDDNVNYLTTNMRKIILYRYKTSQTYGRYVIDINGKLRKILKAYISEYRITVGSPMFPNRNGEFYGNYISKLVSKAFNTVIGIPISNQVIRHSFVSHMLSKPTSLNRRKHLARSLGHSPNMLERYNRLNC